MPIGELQYPGALDTLKTLVEAANDAQTTLTAPLAISDSVAQVVSTAKFSDSGFFAVGNEIFSFDGKTLTTLLNLTHGEQGTTPAGHNPGDKVEQMITAVDHNVLAGAILEIETKLGFGADTPSGGAEALFSDLVGQSNWRAITQADVPGLSAALAGKQPVDADLTAIAALPDPNANRILFWDDSVGAYAYLEAGSGLSIAGTVLSASGGGSGTVNAGAAKALAYYPGAGTAVDDASGLLYDPGANPNLIMSPQGSLAGLEILEIGATSNPDLFGFHSLLALHVLNSSLYYALTYKNDAAPNGWANYLNNSGTLAFDSDTGGQIALLPQGALSLINASGGLAMQYFFASATYYGQIIERSSDHYALAFSASFGTPGTASLTWGDFGVIVKTPPTALADGDLANGETHIYLDESGSKLKFKLKTSGGVIKTAELAYV